MENKNEQVERLQWEEQGTEQLPGGMMGPVGLGSHKGKALGPSATLSNSKRELLSSIELFIGTGLLGFWFGAGATLGAKMVNILKEHISIK